MLTILLIEDNPATARLVETLLGRREFKVPWVQTLGEVGKAMLGVGGVDAVLCDLGLPDSQGIDTLDSVMKLVPDTPVIVMTNLDDEEAALRAVKHGAQDYLIKGEFDAAQLKRSILYAVERKRVFESMGAGGALVDGVLNSARDAVTALEAVRGEDGTISDFKWLLANPAIEQVLGRHARELVGRPLSEGLPGGEGKELFNSLIDVVEKGEVAEYEMPFDRAGVDVWLRVTAVKLHDGVALTLADITERIRSTRAIQGREERLRMIMATVIDGIVTVDENGIIENFNPGAEKIFGYREKDVIGHSVALLLPAEKGAEHRVAQFIKRRTHAVAGGVREFEARAKDGRVFPAEVSIGRLRLGKKNLLIGAVRDITERKNTEERLRFLADRDPLTGLANRNLFAERLNKSLAKAERTGQKMGLLFLDLDMLKNINDTLGHQAGDRVLWETARRLERCVREGDTVARISGDEFVVALDGLKGQEAAVGVTLEILDQLGRAFVVDGVEAFTSGTIGAVLFPDHGKDAAELMKNVDVALHKAKAKGRNTYQFYTEEFSADIMRRHALENGLRRALENGELQVHYQPKVDLQNQKIVGAEALLRWRNETLGSVSPEEFIPVAEDTGQIIAIGAWVLRQACDQVKAWTKKGLPPMRMAVNLSPRQFRDPELTSKILAILSETHMDAGLLELELTESTLVDKAEDAVQALWALKGLGIAISIDDFGTGYSSLSYLKKYPIDSLKIDRSFVRDIPDNAEDVAIARAIISMAHTLEMEIIAEGIEQREQMDFCLQAGCQLGQGFYYSRPVPPDEFVKVYEDMVEGTKRTGKGHLKVLK